ncbi:MAG: hypothetical protein HC860_06830 [Alkalinema sp. RU_4_3]|nr:hypothetical protein [Alkalinema sp. RU_4_3]
MNYRTVTAACAIAAGFWAMVVPPAMGFCIRQTQDEQDLMAGLLGQPAGLSNIELSLGEVSTNLSGIYRGGDFLGLSSGVVLSTGQVDRLVGRNCADGRSPLIPEDQRAGCNGVVQGNRTDLNTDLVDLEANQPLTPGNRYRFPKDIAVLDLDFTAEAGFLNLGYVFGSEEFVESTLNNDYLNIWLNGVNLAQLNDGQSVNVNNLVKPLDEGFQLNPDYIDNAIIGSNPANQITPLDGYTQLLHLRGPLLPGRNNLRIELGDGPQDDDGYDSAVFLGQIQVEQVPGPSMLWGLLSLGGWKLRDWLRQKMR